MVAFPQSQQTLGQLFGSQAPAGPQMSASPLPSDPMAALQAQRPQQPQIKDWQTVLGTIGDALLAAGRRPPQFAPYVQGLQEAERERQQREYEAGMKRLGDRQDFMFEQDYRAKNPGPTEMERTIDYLKQAYPDQVDEYVQHKVNPPLYRQGPDGQFYPVAPPPTKPVGKLTPIMGGTVSNGGGGFR
jgi:hypothetical protein